MKSNHTGRRTGLALSLLLATASTRADLLTVPGSAGSLRFIDTNVSAPFTPTQMEECENYNVEMQRTIAEVDSAHEECLKDAPPESHAGSFGQGVCSKPECQSLHTAKHDLRQTRSRIQGECITQVNAYQKEEERRNKRTYSGETDSPSNSITQERRDTAGRVAKPIIRSHGNKHTRAAEYGIGAAKDATDIKQKCADRTTAAERKACYNAVHSGAERQLSKGTRDPVVKRIQHESFSEIKSKHNEVLDQPESIDDKTQSERRLGQ